MFQSKIRLGTGISKRITLGISNEENLLCESIEQMGFRRELIMDVNPSTEDLLEICIEMKKYGYSIKYQELWEKKINGSKVRTGLYFHKYSK